MSDSKPDIKRAGRKVLITIVRETVAQTAQHVSGRESASPFIATN